MTDKEPTRLPTRFRDWSSDIKSTSEILKDIQQIMNNHGLYACPAKMAVGHPGGDEMKIEITFKLPERPRAA